MCRFAAALSRGGFLFWHTLALRSASFTVNTSARPVSLKLGRHVEERAEEQSTAPALYR
jgi:hypothetical protein